MAKRPAGRHTRYIVPSGRTAGFSLLARPFRGPAAKAVVILQESMRKQSNSNNLQSNETIAFEVTTIVEGNETSAPTFEVALEELERVVAALETGNVPLEESIALLQRGMALAERCDQTLTQAETALEELIATADGELVTQRIDYDDDEDMLTDE